MHGADEPRLAALPTPHWAGGSGVTIAGGSGRSPFGCPRGGVLSGLAFDCGAAKSPLQWMVMLFHGVDGANVPPSISALYWTVVVLVKC
jgi:hypothetical protein